MTLLPPRVLNLDPDEPAPRLLDLRPEERLRYVLHLVQDEATRTEAEGRDSAGHWDESKWGSFSRRGLTNAITGPLDRALSGRGAWSVWPNRPAWARPDSPVRRRSSPKAAMSR